MKKIKNSIVGDPVQVDAYTSKWQEIHLSPEVFYRRYDQFQKSMENLKGLYAEIDMGKLVYIRFSEKDDLTTFHRIHHEYI